MDTRDTVLLAGVAAAMLAVTGALMVRCGPVAWWVALAAGIAGAALLAPGLGGVDAPVLFGLNGSAATNPVALYALIGAVGVVLVWRLRPAIRALRAAARSLHDGAHVHTARKMT